MKINSENCEAWFLDYYEGNLSEERTEEMFAFLDENPEMRELFDSYESFSFQPDKGILFDGKSDLKKTEIPSGLINQSNYEEYFVSYTEGLLNAEEKQMVENFLVQFPSHRHELELLKMAVLSPEEEIVFEQKEKLKKTLVVSAENFDEMAIASMEGLLNREEEKAFSMAVAGNEEQQRAYMLYRKTKLEPDTTVVFEDKESLKRKDRGAFWWVLDVRFAAAAAVALLIGVFYWNFSGKDVNPLQGDLASGKTNPKTNNNGVVVPGKNPPANMDSSTGSVVITDDHNNKQIANKTYSYDIQEDNKPVLTEHPQQIVTHEENITLASNVNSHVDFSDAYYAVAQYQKPVTAPASNDISLRQAAMRWMKKKLDNTPVENQNDDTYTASVPKQNQDVNGFDLTSSAVAALGNATGANLKLGHEQEGTVLTVGKYEVLLNRNN